MEHKNIKVVYRRYASLFFIVGVDSSENELGILEFIHSYVEILDGYFESVVRFHPSAFIMLLIVLRLVRIGRKGHNIFSTDFYLI